MEKKKNASGQMSLIDFMQEEEAKAFEVKYPDVPEFSRDILLSGEKDILGLYVSGHPLDDVKDMLEKLTNITTADFVIDEETLETGAKDNMQYTIGGLIESVNQKLTRNGENMAFIQLEDLYGTVEVVVFPKVYEKYRRLLTENQAIIVKGRSQVSERDSKILASEIYSLTDKINQKEAEKKEVWILYDDMETFLSGQKSLETVLGEHIGYTPVFVQLKKEKQAKRMAASVDLKTGIEEALKLEFGSDRVIVREKKQ